MEKIEVFVKTILKIIFKETPFDQEKAKTSFEKVKNSCKERRGKNDRKTANILIEFDEGCVNKFTKDL